MIRKILCLGAALLTAVAGHAQARADFACGDQTYSRYPGTCPDGSLPVLRGHPSPQQLQAQTLYDAVAVDDATLRFGICINGMNELRTALCALAACTRQGGVACRTAERARAEGGYGAVAVGWDTNVNKACVTGAFGYKTLNAADQMAKRGCYSDDGIKRCKLRAHWYEGRPGIYEDGQ
ncbi:MAG: hypothetical protein M0T84_15070 [Betaproteobacteria bacterium]|nr:hypothetical protein [Betaproteobacteria bacterium]